MRHSLFKCLLALTLLLTACSGHHENPVLPTDPSGGSGGEVLTVIVTSDVSQLFAGSTSATTLHITARHADGTAPADGTEVAVNTNIGAFSFDVAGKPVLLAKTTLAGGNATLQFFAGADVGVANLLAQIGTNVGRLNLPIVATPAPPVANFTFSASGLNVLFSDASSGTPSGYRWQFGDGTESTEKNPAHSYPAPTTYTATLTVTNAGGQASKSQFVTVSLGSAPVAAFDFQVTGRQANFVDRSTGFPTSWSWSFGDGESSTLANPVHTYPAVGMYTVTLTVRNAAGENSTSKVVAITAGSAPVAAFDFAASGLQANFVDRSTGSPTSWFWNFGDGGTDTVQNPVHVYATPGPYTVTLTARNAAGSDSIAHAVIVPGTAPKADFTFSVNGFKVNFADRSSGSPTSWLWDFGDGFNSTNQNPVHTYTAAGNFTVVLTASNGLGSSSKSEIVTIATPPPVADFIYRINGTEASFFDQSTGNPDGWLWDFGDGSPGSSQQNPTHSYAGGQYVVTLTVTNAAGSSSKSKAIFIFGASKGAP